MLKNFNAKASSKNPNVTFTAFNQPPDLGMLLIISGKNAKNVNGNANASEYENIINIGLRICPPAESASTLPTIGTVQLNEMSTSVNAIKNTPINPPLSAC